MRDECGMRVLTQEEATDYADEDGRSVAYPCPHGADVWHCADTSQPARGGGEGGE